MTEIRAKESVFEGTVVDLARFSEYDCQPFRQPFRRSTFPAGVVGLRGIWTEGDITVLGG